jgi:hypothetical protein
VGLIVGEHGGLSVGSIDGVALGQLLSAIEGFRDGVALLGDLVGILLGVFDGRAIGRDEVDALGQVVDVNNGQYDEVVAPMGMVVGRTVGKKNVGSIDGTTLGQLGGTTLGIRDWRTVGSAILRLFVGV